MADEDYGQETESNDETTEQEQLEPELQAIVDNDGAGSEPEPAASDKPEPEGTEPDTEPEEVNTVPLTKFLETKAQNKQLRQQLSEIQQTQPVRQPEPAAEKSPLDVFAASPDYDPDMGVPVKVLQAQRNWEGQVRQQETYQNQLQQVSKQLMADETTNSLLRIASDLLNNHDIAAIQHSRNPIEKAKVLLVSAIRDSNDSTLNELAKVILSKQSTQTRTTSARTKKTVKTNVPTEKQPESGSETEDEITNFLYS